VIAWFARNSVAANLLMVFIVAWGLSTIATRLPLEVFPAFELEQVNVGVAFRGATPVEVEEGITIPVEEALEGLAGVKRVTSTASEGIGTVSVELVAGTDTAAAVADIEQRLRGIGNLPSEAEAPRVTVPEFEREVISVVVSGALPERELRLLAERARDELEALPSVSSVALGGVRRHELAIEIPAAELERHGLTLAGVAEAIEASSLDLAAGAIDTAGGEVLLRTLGQAREAADFAAVVVLARPDGTRITLGDIAEISDGFEEEPLEQRFDGQRSVEISVYRRGLESAIAVADDVKAWIAETEATMPHGVSLGYWRDASRAVRARLQTLLSSALQGGLLILILLTLFLRFWVAVWVFVGVPVSILGGIALMPLFGVSLNMLSLFAFILVLGIVVDDAIVTGENIYTRMRRDPDRVRAAIDGTREVALPVTFGVLTTVVAFSPLLMIEGVRGALFAQIPLVIIPVLLFSIVESKLVLPSHMSHLDFHRTTPPNALARLQYRVADGFEWSIEHLYQPMLAAALRGRYLVLSLFVGGALVVFALVAAGHIRFVFFPRVQSEVARASLEMPEGTPFETTLAHVERITAAAQTLQARHVDPSTNESVIESILSTAGSAGGGFGGGEGRARSHLGRVMFEIVPPEERVLEITSGELVAEWREEIGDVVGAKSLGYRAEIGGGGSPIDVELRGRDFERMREVAAEIERTLRGLAGVSDIEDTFEDGKEEIRIRVLPAAEQLGITLADIARQVRTAFLGAELGSVQRERDEVRVVVRYPKLERGSIASLERLRVRTAAGVEVPLASVATLERGRGFSSIRRVDRRRTVNIRADVDKEGSDVEAIKTRLEALAAELEASYPDVAIGLEGEAREQRESFGSLRVGLAFVLLVVYTLLAIPFRSYVQPLMVMVVIPFGIVGGVLGHVIMGMPLSIMSYMGMLALCGVVVNDSLVLVDWVNRQRRAGVELLEAVRASGVARFRAVILTSLTTFFGLVPLIVEDSTQAQFLIPMAVSLGFGILFATAVTLVLVPVNYLVLEDLRVLFGRLLAFLARVPRERPHG